MISYLRGQVVYVSDILKKNPYIIVDTGGVGYRVLMPSVLFSHISENNSIEIFTYMQVSENDQELYGFLDIDSLEFFKMLLSISGIGPKSALQVLEKAKIDDIKAAVVEQKPDVLSGVSDLSKKMAEKIVFGLKSFAKQLQASGGASAVYSGDMDLIEALQAMGFRPDQAKEALQNIDQTIEKSEDKILEALKILGKK